MTESSSSRHHERNHLLVQTLVANVLREAGWIVDTEALIGGRFRPDLVGTSADDQSLVVEIKAARLNNHLGAVAQAETYKAASASQTGSPVDVLLVLPGMTPPNLREAASQAGVDLVNYEIDDLQSLGEKLKAYLFHR